MSDTTFVNQTTIIVADWLNDVNDAVYHAIGDGTNAPTTPAEVRTNLDVPQNDGTGATGTWPVSISGNAATATVATSALGFSGTVAIANGGTGQVNAAAAFDALKQTATDSYSGVSELANPAEAQAGTDLAKPITPGTMKSAQIVLSTPVTLTNQTFVDFTGIPSWVKRVSIHFFAVSTNGTSVPIIQIGDSGGIETSSYTSGGANTGVGIGTNFNTVVFSTGFALTATTAAASSFSGTYVLERFSSSSDQWQFHGMSTNANVSAVMYFGIGAKTLSTTLDRIRLTTVGGVDQFDAGTINISWE